MKNLYGSASQGHISKSELNPSRFCKSPFLPHCRQNCNSCQQNFPAPLRASGHKIISFLHLVLSQQREFLGTEGSSWVDLNSWTKKSCHKDETEVTASSSYIYVKCSFILLDLCKCGSKCMCFPYASHRDWGSNFHGSHRWTSTVRLLSLLEKISFSSAVSPQNWHFFW